MFLFSAPKKKYYSSTLLRRRREEKKRRRGGKEKIRFERKKKREKGRLLRAQAWAKKTPPMSPTPTGKGMCYLSSFFIGSESQPCDFYLGKKKKVDSGPDADARGRALIPMSPKSRIVSTEKKKKDRAVPVKKRAYPCMCSNRTISPARKRGKKGEKRGKGAAHSFYSKNGGKERRDNNRGGINGEPQARQKKEKRGYRVRGKGEKKRGRTRRAEKGKKGRGRTLRRDDWGEGAPCYLAQGADSMTSLRKGGRKQKGRGLLTGGERKPEYTSKRGGLPLCSEKRGIEFISGPGEKEKNDKLADDFQRERKRDREKERFLSLGVEKSR